MPKAERQVPAAAVPFGASDVGPVLLDPAALITTKALVTANSGGGKSYALRKLCELLGRTAPLVVLDMEGEFVTLRERIDLVVVGPGGEIPADVRSAGLLARRLVERSLSAVVDLSELRMDDRRAFVRRFCVQLVELHKSLWRPLFIVLDEAHQFCPEKGQGEAESTAAVIDLCTLGRKRSFCPILATQRVSTLHKTAAGECNNKLIGRMTLDLDVKRAAFELGTSPKETLEMLRGLRAGEFYSFGPAMRPEGVTRMRVAEVETTHPKPGQGRLLVPPAPSSAVAAVARELTDLPQQAEAEAKDLAAAAARIAALERELATARDARPPAGPPPAELADLQDRTASNARLITHLRAELSNAMATIDQFVTHAGKGLAVDPEAVRGAVQAAVDVVLLAAQQASDERAAALSGVVFEAAAVLARGKQLLDAAPPAAPRPATTREVTPAPAGGSAAPLSADQKSLRASLPPTDRDVLDAAASFPGGATRQRISTFTGRSTTSSSFGAALSNAPPREGGRPSLLHRGLLQLQPDGRYVPTPAGQAIAVATAGVSLADWLAKLKPSEAKVLRCIADARPARLTRAEVAGRTATSEKSSSFGGAFSALRDLGLIEGERDFAAAESLPRA